MHQHELISLVIFSGAFLFTASMLHNTTKKFTLLPYTSALLLVGLLSQLGLSQLGFQTHISLGPDVIYFILLPLLLFESAMHINLHQFKLQFKTIAFLATFGLMSSMVLVGVLLSWLLGLPLVIGLLFGTIISATDPIAVVALFKSLGAPKRLGLLAEGESMFNDATAVIAFRTLLTFAMTGAAIEFSHITSSGLDFLYVSLGSALVGGIMGFVVAQVIAKIKNDRLVETTLTLSLALSSFVVAEHFFHFSGVISTVVAALVLGNLGRTKISGGVVHFIEEFWEYVSFMAISLVFFFATFNLDLAIFNRNLSGSLIVIAVMLLGRAVSVYISFFVSNHTRFFHNEPNVPFRWQHIINWGGMRGVIPLVLVYSLPQDFLYKQDFLSFTVSAFLFTLFVNAVSIRTLLTKLGIHIPKTEEAILRDEEQLIELFEAEEEIKHLPKEVFDPKVLRQTLKEINQKEAQFKKDLLLKGGYQKLLRSLRLQALRIEAETFKRLFHEGGINESVYFDLETELDLQLDAMEYPEVVKGRGYRTGGYIDSQSSFRHQVNKIHAWARRHPLLTILVGMREVDVIINRLQLLKARIISSQEVVAHLEFLEKALVDEPKALKAIRSVIKHQHTLVKRNQKQIDKIEKMFPEVAQAYQADFLHGLIQAHTSAGSYDH